MFEVWSNKKSYWTVYHANFHTNYQVKDKNTFELLVFVDKNYIISLSVERVQCFMINACLDVIFMPIFAQQQLQDGNLDTSALM